MNKKSNQNKCGLKFMQSCIYGLYCFQRQPKVYILEQKNSPLPTSELTLRRNWSDAPFPKAAPEIHHSVPHACLATQFS